MFSAAFWTGTSAATRLGFFSPILLASSLHSLGRACGFASVLPHSHFVLLFPFGVVSSAVRSKVDSKSRGRVPWEQAELLPPPAVSHTDLPSPYSFYFPRLNFLDSKQAHGSPSIINFFLFYLFFMCFPPTFLYSPFCRRVVVAAGGCWYGAAQPRLWTSPFDKLSSPGPAQGFDQSALSTPWKTLNTLPDPFLCLHL